MEHPVKPPSTFRIILGDRLLLAGAILFVVGCGPLFIWLAIDPTANPVGPGMLTMCTFWPSILLMVAGGIRGAIKAANAGKGL